MIISRCNTFVPLLIKMSARVDAKPNPKLVPMRQAIYDKCLAAARKNGLSIYAYSFQERICLEKLEKLLEK